MKHFLHFRREKLGFINKLKIKATIFMLSGGMTQKDSGTKEDLLRVVKN
jgi:hypothetical protein